MNIKSEILLRVRVAFLVVFLFGLGVAARMMFVQWAQGEYWKEQARERMTQRKAIKATPGNIFTEEGGLLATSIPRYRVAFDPKVPEEKLLKDSLKYLSVLLSDFYQDKTPKEYERKFKEAREDGKEFIFVNTRMITYSEKKKMQKWPIFNKGRYKGGVIFERIDRRYQPFKYLAQRTIGFINDDGNGVGLEYSFKNKLKGQDGEALFQRISGGIWKPIFDGDDVKPEPGMDIYTTIDINIQDVAENSLLNAVTEHDAEYGCAIVMEVETGEIKALANLGKRKNGGYGETYNYAIGPQGLTDPGSTFKLASLMALFEETSLELNDSISTGDGILKYYDSEMRDSKKGGHGRISVQQAFELSSNIAFVKMVTTHFGNKQQRFIDYMKSFGLTSNLGFQMKGTAQSTIKTPKDKTWSAISLPWISVGYETSISPLQMLCLYNAVANNGNMIQPLIVKEVKTEDEVVESYKAVVLKEKICSPKTLSKLKKCLIGVVERGTAKNIKNENYKIAGKTGTSQKFKNGRYIEKYYTSFAGYFPADKPKYSCIIVIDEPKGFKQHGADVAAPVFKDIADKIYARDVEMHKRLTNREHENSFPVVKSGNSEDLQFLCNELKVPNRASQGSEWVSATINQNSISWKKKSDGMNQVPDVKGLVLRDAIFLLENKGLSVKFSGSGRVQSQSQEPGERAIKGSTIHLELE